MADASQSDGDGNTFKIVPAVRIRVQRFDAFCSLILLFISVTLVGLER